jgi:hypothetical protein
MKNDQTKIPGILSSDSGSTHLYLLFDVFDRAYVSFGFTGTDSQFSVRTNNVMEARVVDYSIAKAATKKLGGRFIAFYLDPDDSLIEKIYYHQTPF